MLSEWQTKMKKKKYWIQIFVIIDWNTNHARAYVFNKFNDSINFFVHNKFSVSLQNRWVHKTMRISSHVWFFSVFWWVDFFFCIVSQLWKWINLEKKKEKNDDICLFYEFTSVPFIYESFWHTKKHFYCSLTKCICFIWLRISNTLLVIFILYLILDLLL